MKLRTIILATVLFVAVITAGLILPTQVPLTASPIVPSPQAVGVVTSGPVSISSSTNGPIALLAVTENENGLGLDARPVDPTTLAPLSAYSPISFGHHYTEAVSPDRKTLAVMTWPRGSSNGGGTLHLIDLATWAERPLDLPIHSDVSELTFGADGKAIYWTSPARRDPAHNMPRDYQLYRFDLDRRQLSVLVQLPSSFMPWSQHISESEVAILGVPTDPNNLAEDAPHVLIVDPASQTIAADVRLAGVKAGQFYESVGNETPSGQGESGQYVAYQPGLAWDSTNNRLYVVHSDGDQVAIVDLVKGIVIQPASLLSQPPARAWLFGLSVPMVEAKGGPVTEARAIVSDDGHRLYAYSQMTEGGLLGGATLRAIATGGLREISRRDDLLTDVALTPDGKALVVVKGEIVSPNGFDELVNRDVYILDAETLQERLHVRSDEADQLSIGGFSPDGRYAYLSGASATWVEGEGWRDWRSTWQVLDLQSGSFLSTVEFKGSNAVLLHLLP